MCKILNFILHPLFSLKRIVSCWCGDFELARKANNTVDRLFADVLDRRGIKHEFRQCEPSVLLEIKNTWKKIIMEEMG
jgi:hypothetical protein